MRLIVRKERPHPGAQLRFTDADGHAADLLRHQHHRQPDRRTGAAAPPAGPRRGPHPRRPRHRPAQPAPARRPPRTRSGWRSSRSPCDLLAWMPMLALTGKARRWEPRRLRLRLFSAAAQTRHHRPPPAPPIRPPLALDRRDRSAIDRLARPTEPRLTSDSHPDEQEGPDRDRGTRRPPDATAGPPGATRRRKTAGSRGLSPQIQDRETSRLAGQLRVPAVRSA